LLAPFPEKNGGRKPCVDPSEKKMADASLAWTILGKKRRAQALFEPFLAKNGPRIGPQ
jgi:hypothetical protein